MPEKKEEVTAAGKQEPIDHNKSSTMNIYNNAPSTSRNQHGHHVAGEPMDLADTLSYVDRVPNWTEVWDPRMSTSFTTTKGLLNGPGENNCFLNSAVQVLWHLDVFRRNFRQLSGHMCMGNSCIFCALKVIFTQFQYSDRSTLPPDALRKALAWTFADQQKFQIGVMDDAAECFENILVRIHFHIVNSEPEDMCRAKHCIPHQKFAMNVVEQIVCPTCGATSEPLPFNQMVYYVSASALVRQAKFLQAQGGFPQHQFGQVLRSAVSQGDYRDCPSNCGEKVAIRRNLINLPDVVSVGLVWDSDRPITEHIHDVMTAIRTTLRLTDLFHSVVDERQAQTTILQLVGVVCYYGKHYSTFFFHSKMKKWISFDDATVREMGTEWSSVVDKCCRGHYQPLLLLYAKPNDSSISMETAPRSTVMVNSDYCFNQSNGGFNSVKGNHARQRSADRDANDILPGGHKVPTSHAPLVHDSKPCRAITPMPQGSQNHCSAPNRRATTPSAELGREGKPAIVHFRQPSYLIAVDGKENGVTCTCSGDTARADTYGNTVVPPMGNEAYCNYDSVDGPCKKYTSQTSGRSENGIDLLGSLPPEGPTTNGCYLSPAVSRAVPSMQGRLQNQMAINEAIHSRVAEFVHTPSPARVSGVPLQRASNGQSGSMQQASNKCLYTENNHCPDYRAQDMPHRWQQLRRSGSLEEVDLPPDGVGYNKAVIMAQRTRPQSARPFDYRNNVVKHPMGATNYAPGRCTNNPGERCETRTMNKMAAWMMSSTSEAGEEVYINSKTVRNILDYQKVQHQLHPATRLASQQEGRSGSPSCTTQAPSSSTTQAPLSSTAGAVTGSRSMQVEPPMTYANHNLVSRMTKTHPTNIQSHHGDSFDKTPYDSQRSSDSSGDRNSASSASSSMDSTDSYKGYYNTRQNGTSRHGSSKESSSSTQNCSNPSAAGTTKQRLVNIPESLMESRQPGSRQTSEMEKSEPTPNEKFENLCMHAEGLMDSSNRKEKGGDLPQALLHCNRAIGCVQKALAMGGVGQDSKVHAQVKCNTCVMRSRSLHRKMMTRQDSNDHTSLSVTDQDVRPPEGVTSTSKAGVVHSKQASVPSVYKRVESLYSNKTPKDAERELQQCINRLATIDGLSQSVERNIADKTVPPGILKKPKQRAPKPKPPVRTSSIEQKKTTPSSQSQQTPQQQRRQIPVLNSKPKQQLDQSKLLPQNSRLSNQQQEQLAQFASVTSCVEAYATLPRKPGQRASRQLAESGLETDVYESYLQRQRAATSCMPGAQNTVAASSGCVMRQPATTAQYENREEGNRVRSQPRPTSACSYRCQDEATSNTNPSIMEQLIHEGLIAPRVPVSDTPKYHTPNSLHSHGIPQDNVMARDNDRQVRLSSVHPNRPEQPVQHQGRSASAVAGRRTPQPHVTQFGRPLVEGRMTPKQKQWAVTEALYYGMPTVAMTQQRSCTPTSDHSALQGEGIDGSDSSSYWGAFPPKNDLRKSSSQGYLTSSRPGQQSDSPCTPLVHTAPLLPQQATDPETTGNSQTCTIDDANCAAGRTASSASWHHEHRSATNEFPGVGDQRQLCHGKETQYKFVSQPVHCTSETHTREENMNLMPVSSGSENVTQHDVKQCCHHDDDTVDLTLCNRCVSDDNSVSWNSQCSDVDSLNFNVNSSESTQNYILECGNTEPELIHENKQDSDLVCSHTEPELIHNDIPESLPKPGLKPAIKSEETLMKTRNQRRWPRRRVTFSENIALISLADAGDSEAVDYMAYVTSTLVNRQHQSTSQGDVGACTVAPPSVDPQVVVAGVKTGSSDDAMAESVDWNASDKVQCMLCRKRLVDMTEVYCPDCQHYMSRFMPLISQC